MSDVIPGLSWDDYTAIDALNPSLIKRGLKSMKQFKWGRENPQPTKDAFVFGHAVHTVVFEPHELDHRFLVFDGRRDKRTSAYQDALAQAEETGSEIIKTADLEAAVAIGLAVTTHPKVKPIIASGQAEVTVTAEEYGRPCKGRLDWVCSQPGFADLKTARNIQSFAFGKAFFEYGYDVSLGLYQRWLARIRGQDEPCWVLCVEKEPPYDAAVVLVPQEVLDRGRDKGLRIIERVNECEKTGVWPGVDEGDWYPLHVPYYEMGDDEMEEFQG